MISPLLEKAINYILKSDPETLARLSLLEGKVVKISFIDWKLDSFLVIKEQGVQLLSSYSGNVDTTIRGKLAGLIKVSRSGASGPALFDQGIEISGDVELGEKIRDILRRIDLDPEEQMSHYIGDIAAHEVTWRTKRAIELGKQTWLDLRENFREFCQIEAQYLPARHQAEEFYTEVSRLRDDVDRAAARLDRLKSKLTGSH